MSIISTVKSLYAVMCGAQAVCDTADSSVKDRLLPLLRMISDEDVSATLSQIEYLLAEMAAVTNNLKSMYILHYKTGTDRENKAVLLQTEMVWGRGTVINTTQFDQKAAQSLIDALSMSLAMVKAGNRLAEEGNA